MHGKVPNVVFTCGAIEKDGLYHVYYGGADKVIGVATIEKDVVQGSLKQQKILLNTLIIGNITSTRLDRDYIFKPVFPASSFLLFENVNISAT